MIIIISDHWTFKANYNSWCILLLFIETVIPRHSLNVRKISLPAGEQNPSPYQLSSSYMFNLQ